MRMGRDLVGYGENPPVVPWPGGARVAVNVAINYEEGAESSIAEGDERDEDVTLFGGLSADPARRSRTKESHFEYGSRAGIWRLLRILADSGVPATVFACGRALERNPRVGVAAVEAGHEVCAHGYRWRGQLGMTEEQVAEDIRRCADAIEQVTGKRPVGWYSRDGIAECARDLLAQEGFLYDSNDYSDDLPFYVPVATGNHLVVPYAGDANDARYWGAASFSTANDFFEVMQDSVRLLLEEGESAPKMMSIGFHARIGGRPGIAIALSRFLDWAKTQPGVWFATREQIARHWLEHGPQPSAPHGSVDAIGAPR